LDKLKEFNRRDGARIEMSKDVAAMANAEGGIIIYGIDQATKEGNLAVPSEWNFPSKKINREGLLQQIAASINPPIPGIRIECISPSETAEGTGMCVVVEVPKSTEVHQSEDKIFHRRHDAIVLPMSQSEVMEVSRRASWPDVDCEVGIGVMSDYKYGDGYANNVHICAENLGPIRCKYFCIRLTVPPIIGGGAVSFQHPGPCYQTNYGWGLQLEFEAHNLLPSMQRHSNSPFGNSGRIGSHIREFQVPLRDLVRVEVYADDMPPKKKWLRLQDVITTVEEENSRIMGPIRIQPGVPGLD